jgi:hypothetical protein
MHSPDRRSAEALANALTTPRHQARAALIDALAHKLREDARRLRLRCLAFEHAAKVRQEVES